MDADGITIGIGSGVAALAIRELCAWLRARYTRTVIPQPCDVRKVNDCVSVKECNRRMKELDERVTRLETKFDQGIDKVMYKLSAMDRESEARAVALHRRIDTISEKTSETSGSVEMIKGKMFKR